METPCFMLNTFQEHVPSAPSPSTRKIRESNQEEGGISVRAQSTWLGGKRKGFQGHGLGLKYEPGFQADHILSTAFDLCVPPCTFTMWQDEAVGAATTEFFASHS